MPYDAQDPQTIRDKKKIKELRDILTRVHRILDVKEWEVDTIESIADVIHNNFKRIESL